MFVFFAAVKSCDLHGMISLVLYSIFCDAMLETCKEAEFRENHEKGREGRVMSIGLEILSDFQDHCNFISLIFIYSKSSN